MSVGFWADQSHPGDSISSSSFLNFVDKNGNPTDDYLAEIWAQYTYDKNYDPDDPASVNKKIAGNHAVCIVGYDDNFPKEYFKDPNGTIAGNGAFLAKNSWALMTAVPRIATRPTHGATTVPASSGYHTMTRVSAMPKALISTPTMDRMRSSVI